MAAAVADEEVAVSEGINNGAAWTLIKRKISCSSSRTRLP